MDEKKYTSKKPAISVTLGEGVEAEKRIQNLDRIAKAYSVKRSKLIQMIADGKLDVVPASERRAV